MCVKCQRVEIKERYRLEVSTRNILINKRKETTVFNSFPIVQFIEYLYELNANKQSVIVSCLCKHFCVEILENNCAFSRLKINNWQSKYMLVHRHLNLRTCDLKTCTFGLAFGRGSSDLLGVPFKVNLLTSCQWGSQPDIHSTSVLSLMSVSP